MLVTDKFEKNNNNNVGSNLIALAASVFVVCSVCSVITQEFSSYYQIIAAKITLNMSNYLRNFRLYRICVREDHWAGSHVQEISMSGSFLSRYGLS